MLFNSFPFLFFFFPIAVVGFALIANTSASAWLRLFFWYLRFFFYAYAKPSYISSLPRPFCLTGRSVCGWVRPR